jgi:Ran GTPase-activating protein (RanGAP) involved in mRNA processing and transport
MADIGPIGGAIYANQQMASVASEKTALLNRFELQTLAAAAAANEKNNEVQEVRPAEENQAVDPDREHTKEQAEQEQQRSKKREEDNLEEEARKPLHLLDVKV